ncbi:DUF4328 domain-containing protein [Streptomyces sp. ISL-10]|nr:DUF4328 domain-containing protein [Streptomyces sp. ISL-10]
MSISAPQVVLRSPVGLGRAVAVLLLLVAVSDIAAMVAALNLRRLAGFIAAADFIGYSDEDAELADALMVGTSLVQVIAYLATVVVFIVWFHRVRTNADVFAPDLLRRGRGWAIGGWFIPFAGLWIPRGIAADVWTASRTDPYAGDEHEPRTLVNIWWAAFVASMLCTRYAEQRYEKAETAEEIISATEKLLVSNTLEIVAAVLAILFVRRLTHMQHTKALEQSGLTAAV